MRLSNSMCCGGKVLGIIFHRCVYVFMYRNEMHTRGYRDTLHSRLEPALLGLLVKFKNLEESIRVSSKSS